MLSWISLTAYSSARNANGSSDMSTHVLTPIKILAGFFIIINVISGCESPKSPMNSFNEIEIEPKNVAKKVLSYSELFIPLGYVPLETNKESFLQGIDRLIFFDENIYILDTYGSKKIKIFSQKGKYIRDVGSQGKGPMEYIEAIDFAVTKEEILILSHRKIIIYNHNGEYLREINLEFYASNFCVLNDNYVFYGSELEDRIIVTNFRGEKLWSSQKYTKRNKIYPIVPLQKMDSLAIVSIPLIDTIYAVSSSNKSIYVNINYGSATFTDKSYMDNGGDKSFDASLFLSKNEEHAVTMFHQRLNDYEYVGFQYQKKLYAGVYSKLHSKVVITQLKPENDNLWYSSLIAVPFAVIIDNQFVFIKNPIDVLKGRAIVEERLKSKSITPQEKIHLNNMMQLYEKVDKNANPIIFIATINQDAFQ